MMSIQIMFVYFAIFISCFYPFFVPVYTTLQQLSEPTTQLWSSELLLCLTHYGNIFFVFYKVDIR